MSQKPSGRWQKHNNTHTKTQQYTYKNTTIHIQNKDKRGNLRINVKLRRVRVTIVTVEKQ